MEPSKKRPAPSKSKKTTGSDASDASNAEDDIHGAKKAVSASSVSHADKSKHTKKDKKVADERKTMSIRAGVTFPVARIAKALKKGGYAKRVGSAAPVFLSAVLEYVTAEILELAGNVAKEAKKQRLVPRHLQTAIRNDEELNKYMGNVTIAGGGVMPNIHAVLLPKKSQKDDIAPTGSYSQEF